MAMGLCSSARFVCGDIFGVITTLERGARNERPALRVSRVLRAQRGTSGPRRVCLLTPRGDPRIVL
jgi:hypothetical protein